jgi:hypothetical protein
MHVKENYRIYGIASATHGAFRDLSAVGTIVL